MNLFSELEQFADRLAFINADGQRYTYKWVIDRGDELATQTPSRSLVFLIGSNTPDCLAGYVGFLRKGVVPVMISHTAGQEALNRLIELYQPNYIFRPSGQQSSVYELVKLNDSPIEIHPELAIILTTSGSTGSPKFVRLSYKNLESNARSIIQYLEIESTHRAITTLPMTYSYGLSIINSHLLSGASIILTEASLMDRNFWGLIKSEQPTNFGGVPFIYEMLKKLRFARMNYPSIKYITQAGGHLSPELVKEFRELCAEKGIKFIVMYGQTEATARMAYMPWDKLAGRENSIGLAIPGGKFFLSDDSGNEITVAHTPGELCYQGENVSLGYAQSREDLAKGDENGGVLKTGDVAQFDSDGFYYIVGRKKRFLKIFGNRVNLDEVQDLLRQKGIESACAGKDDAMKVFVQDGVDCVGVRQTLAELTHLNQSAFTVISIPAIPRNESGKILYSQLPE